jgi:hypothetical protein
MVEKLMGRVEGKKVQLRSFRLQEKTQEISDFFKKNH